MMKMIALVYQNKVEKYFYYLKKEGFKKRLHFSHLPQPFFLDIKINTFDSFVLDRSMNSDKFKKISGYKSPSWKQLVENMYNHVMNEDCYKNKFFRK